MYLLLCSNPSPRPQPSHPAATCQNIQKYPLMYQQTAKQFLASVVSSYTLHSTLLFRLLGNQYHCLIILHCVMNLGCLEHVTLACCFGALRSFCVEICFPLLKRSQMKLSKQSKVTTLTHQKIETYFPLQTYTIAGAFGIFWQRRTSDINRQKSLKALYPHRSCLGISTL